jgi:hypothetical protein
MTQDHNMHSKIEVIAAVQSLLHTEPFRPFEIVTTAGKACPVPHPEYVQISLVGSRVYVDGADGSLTIIHASQIAHVSTKTGRKARKVA